MFQMYLLGPSVILLAVDMFNYFYCIELNLKSWVTMNFWLFPNVGSFS